MALNMCEMWFNGIKIASFTKKLQKIAQQLGASTPDAQNLRPLGAPSPAPPRLWYVWVTLAFSTRLQSYVFVFFNFISLSPLPLQNPG